MGRGKKNGRFFKSSFDERSAGRWIIPKEGEGKLMSMVAVGTYLLVGGEEGRNMGR